MGLDSVELVIEIEKYFNIEIPDKEAEKATTIQEMVDCVAKILSISNNSTALRDSMVNKIQTALLSLNIIEKSLSPFAPIFLTLTPKDKARWQSFCNKMGLTIPKPHIREKSQNTFFNKIKNKISWQPVYEWDKISVEHFADAICNQNCSTLVNRLNIKNTYDIYIAVARITVDKIGVDEYEISPEKSFTNDLGID